ncbi:phosphotransferase family protein [Leptolyngbya sp. KIOST-1]|uniref:phosphotransferase family protein n=1 Tax=Leptolyngbya sp. KIOST-1 TaxID=1229172 RepID=UPI000AA6D276|nr:aminoglycoside phosphotransferase family protein [Leptolyngbya sp. KIOST-1]
MLDIKIPFLEEALDRTQAQRQLQGAIPTLKQVTTANLVRHKVGRRALVEYQAETAVGPLTLLGKIRAKGTDRTTYQIQQALWHHGWDAASADGFSTPEPLGLVPDWHMILQRRVPGVPLTERLNGPDGVALMPRVAALAYKLHRTPLPTAKTHTLADELKILRDRLPLVAAQHPQWAARIAWVLDACDRLAAQFPDPGAEVAGLIANVHAMDNPRHLATPQPCNPTTTPYTLIHRDFYADQILVDGSHLWLVDLDLCCQGPPAVDIGNFIAHITEQSLRELGDAGAMGDREVTLKSAYSEAYGNARSADALGREIDLYTTLTLVRHIHISNRINRRRLFTEALLAQGEMRLETLLNREDSTKR